MDTSTDQSLDEIESPFDESDLDEIESESDDSVHTQGEGTFLRFLL